MAKRKNDGDGEQVSRTPDDGQIKRFRDFMAEAREQRSEANAAAGEAREILKGLGYSPKAIAMYKAMVDMGPEAAMATVEEFMQLVNADPELGNAREPDMFADAQIKETKGKGSNRRNARTPDEALEAARGHLGVVN